MSRDVDLAVLRRRAGNLRPEQLVNAGSAYGWAFNASRGKGSHGALVKTGHRPIIIPRKLKKGTALGILKRIDEVLE